MDVFVVRAETVEHRGRDLAILVDGWLKALDRLRADPRWAAERMAPREGITTDELLAALALVRIPDRSENLSLLAPPMQTLRKSLERQRDTMARSGMIIYPVSLEPLLEPRFLRSGSN